MVWLHPPTSGGWMVRAAVRLGEDSPLDVSPDWKWMLSAVGSPALGLKIVPIGAGEPRTLPRGTIQTYLWAFWHADGKRILVSGNEAGRPVRAFVQALPDGLPRAVTPEGVEGGGTEGDAPFSPDGRFVMGYQFGRRVPPALYPMEGGEPRPIPGLNVGDRPMRFSDDGRSLFVRASGDDSRALVVRGSGEDFPMRIVRVDLGTGRRQPWLELTPPDRAGVSIFPQPWITPNGRFYAYNYWRTLSDLYVAEGLR